MAGFVQMLPTVVSVFKMTENYSSIDGCLRYVQREDHEFIFNPKYPHEFLKYSLCALYIERDLSEMRKALKKIVNPRKLLMETISELNTKVDGYEDDPDNLIHEIIEEIFKAVSNEDANSLVNDLEILEIGLNSLKVEVEHESLNHLVEIWRRVDEQRKLKENFNLAYWKILALILKHHKKFNYKNVEIDENFGKFHLAVECQLRIKNHKIILKNVEHLIEISKEENELKKLIEIFEILSVEFEIEEDFEIEIESLMKSFYRLFKDLGRLSVGFWER